VVNTDMYTKERTTAASSSKSGPVITKREVKKVSSITYCICLFSSLERLDVIVFHSTCVVSFTYCLCVLDSI
jgi:hypothetical protein